MPATKKKKRVRAITRSILTVTLAVVASTGRCDSLDELRDKSFYLSQADATVSVTLGKELTAKRDGSFTVPYVLNIRDMTYGEGTFGRSLRRVNYDEEYTGVGNISSRNGALDGYFFWVKEQKLRITIGGDPNFSNEFRTSGAFWAHAMRPTRQGEKPLPFTASLVEAPFSLSGPWVKKKY